MRSDLQQIIQSDQNRETPQNKSKPSNPADTQTKRSNPADPPHKTETIKPRKPPTMPQRLKRGCKERTPWLVSRSSEAMRLARPGYSTTTGQCQIRLGGMRLARISYRPTKRQCGPTLGGMRLARPKNKTTAMTPLNILIHAPPGNHGS
jgi:hypothetical protein